MGVASDVGRVARPSPREASATLAPPVREPIVQAPREPPPAPVREAAPSRLPPIDANTLAERWDDVVAAVRAKGRALLAAALSETTPAAVSGQGVVTLQLDAPDEIRSQALESGKGDTLDALRTLFSGVERIVVRATANGASAAAPKRITDESVRADRVAALRKRDPTLGAAVDALDLDLIE